MTGLDWVFVAHILLALALALGWLDAPVLLTRWTRTRRLHLANRKGGNA
ncbi:hypothetical protein QBA57_28785 [Streptomyces scabiei]|nr:MULTISPECIES: hypothetical protein [Streptomyces]MDX2628623.1 hypothetical protein [Streptomyces scabiei]MDX3162711.1 hypothetical protein [Streptomyces scabiei]